MIFALEKTKKPLFYQGNKEVYRLRLAILLGEDLGINEHFGTMLVGRGVLGGFGLGVRVCFFGWGNRVYLQ